MAQQNRIREWREKREFTVETLAEAAGLSPGYLSRMERGKRNVSLKNLTKLAAALSIHERDLVGAQMRPIPVVGLVGAGGAISTEWEQIAEPLFQIELPFPVDEDAVGFEISGGRGLDVRHAPSLLNLSDAKEEARSLICLARERVSIFIESRPFRKGLNLSRGRDWTRSVSGATARA